MLWLANTEEEAKDNIVISVEGNLDDFDYDDDTECYTHACRCGDQYIVSCNCFFILFDATNVSINAMLM